MSTTGILSPRVSREPELTTEHELTMEPEFLSKTCALVRRLLR